MKSGLVEKPVSSPVCERSEKGGLILNLGAYEKEWVALSEDYSRVIAHDPDIGKCAEAAEAAGFSPGEFVLDWVAPIGVLRL
jgi:hypothetical protein